MDAIGETVENVGLAQEIQKGLAKSMQTPPKWAAMQADIDAKKAELEGKSMADLQSDVLGKNIIAEWATVNGTATTDEAFKATHLEVLAKYMVLRAHKKAETPSGKLFEEMRPLGKGAFGAVFLVFNKTSGAPFATKKCVKAIAKQNKMIKDVLIEREVLAKIASPFCVNLHYAYQDDITIYLVLTLMAGGDLSFVLKSQYDKDKKFKPLPGDCVRFYAASMACGLQAIHEAGYVYRDLKPQNVLLDGEGLVRISDMGLTADISKGPIKQCSGTRGYWSPETIAKQPYTTQPDWWSLGVTMFVLFSDKLPFHGKTDEEKDAATTEGKFDFKHDEPAELQKVILALCEKDITKRLGGTRGLAELKEHSYFAGFDWAKLETGQLEPEYKPNPNDINAPSKNEIAAFKKPKDVEWTDADQAAFASWEFFNEGAWNHEILFRVKKYKELGGGGGGGCCTIA